MILIEARRLAIEMSITDFAGTTSWCERFMRRNGLCMHTKTTTAQKLPRKYERKIIEFHKYVINMRKKLCFEIGQLGNTDEVPLTFDVPSNKTVDVKGAKTIMIKTSGNEKTRYTVVLACCADGTKLPSLLIFKGVAKFIYLGTLISNDKSVEKEIQKRILAGNRTYFATISLFRSRLLSRATKILLYKTLIRPLVSYGAEAWTMTKKDE